MTKTYTTSQVVRILEKHATDGPAWIFEAPETDSDWEQRATGYNAFVVFGERDGDGEWEDNPRPSFRSDWVRVNPPPRKRTKVGSVTVSGKTVSLTNTKAFAELPDGDYELVAVKR